MVTAVRSGNKLQSISSINWLHNNDHYVSLNSPIFGFGMLNWVNSIVRKETVLVRVRMETLCLNSGM